MAKTLKGITVNEGIVYGPVEILNHEIYIPPMSKSDDVEQTIFELNRAIEYVKNELVETKEKALSKTDATKAMIFDAQLEFLEDPDLIDDMISSIKAQHYDAAYAIYSVGKDYENLFLQMEDSYMKDRIDDFRFVKQMLIDYFLEEKKEKHHLSKQSIIIASDISPSDAIHMDASNILGFVTEKGTQTSHVSILARSLNISAIVGVKDLLHTIKAQDMILMDTTHNKIYINPDEMTLEKYKYALSKTKEQVDLSIYKNQYIYDHHHKHIEIAANIAQPNDVDAAIDQGAEAIGLFRSEFLYMDKKNAPTEEEQYQDYKYVLTKMKDKKVVIRTLDIGGDKHLDYLTLDHEENPFLGKRAIRLCLSNVDLFKTQIRALLRASVHGNLHIMIPMISTIEELRETKTIIKACEQELERKNIAYQKDYKLGMMMEVPAACLNAEAFAQEIDFFSIGTNDLIQYTFAADRMNASLSYLYQPDHIAITKLIEMVVKAAHKHKKWVGVCGEMASQPKYAKKLIEIGVDELSMQAVHILKIKRQLSKQNKTS